MFRNNCKWKVAFQNRIKKFFFNLEKLPLQAQDVPQGFGVGLWEVPLGSVITSPRKEGLVGLG